MRNLLAFLGVGRSARLARMESHARNVARRSYAMSAGYFPPEYRRYHLPSGETIGKVRILQGDGFRSIPPPVSAFRKSYPSLV